MQKKLWKPLGTMEILGYMWVSLFGIQKKQSFLCSMEGLHDSEGCLKMCYISKLLNKGSFKKIHGFCEGVSIYWELGVTF